MNILNKNLFGRHLNSVAIFAKFRVNRKTVRFFMFKISDFLRHWFFEVNLLGVGGGGRK